MHVENNLFVMTDVVHVNHSSGVSLSLLMMDIPWLLIAIMGLATTKVLCQTDPKSFANPPPRPVKGLSYVKKCTNTIAPKCIVLYNNCLTMFITLGSLINCLQNYN